MTSEQVIQQLRNVQTALDENNVEQVAEETTPLIEALDEIAAEEDRRHKAATELGNGAAGDDDSNDREPEREFSVQNVRVNAFRDQIMMALIEYLTMDDPAAEVASLISDRIDELIGAEKDLNEREAEIGTHLDSQYEQDSLLTIESVAQEAIITDNKRDGEFIITVRNMGGNPGQGTIVVMSDENVVVDKQIHGTGEVSSGGNTKITVPFEVESLLIEEVGVYLVNATAGDLDEINEAELYNFVLSNAIDSYHQQIKVDIPEEKRAPSVIERGVQHSFTDPRDRGDYMTIAGTTGGVFTAAGYASYRKFLSNGSPSMESDQTSTAPEGTDDGSDETDDS